MIPSSDVDLFTDDLLDDPYDAYRELRELGPVVYLEQLDMFAVTRYDGVRAALLDDKTFCSGQGVALNDIVNKLSQGTTLASDGETHRIQREIIGRPLTPKNLSVLRDEAQQLADALVDRLVRQETFDAVRDLAVVIPTTWVPDLLGWPDDSRDNLLAWGEAAFNILGPLNERAQAAMPDAIEMGEFARKVARSDSLPPGSMAAGVINAAERGEITHSQCPNLLIDYLGPSLDTTVTGLGTAIWLFGQHQDQWKLLCHNPTMLHNAFNEVLRYETPLTMFSRMTTADTTIGGVPVKAGSRVLMMYASANRDERRWTDPDTFDITRPASGQLSFGQGVHTCAGAGLARLETSTVLTAMMARVPSFRIGTPVRKYNNLIRSLESLPVEVGG